MPDQDAQTYWAAFMRAKNSREEWVEATLEMAALLHRKREELKRDPNFGAWLRENGVNDLHNPHDRAALIGLGADLVLASKVLGETASISLQLIWKNKKFMFASTSKHESALSKGILMPLKHGMYDHIVAIIKERGAEGATAREVAIALNKKASSVGARITEACHAGVLVKTAKTRSSSEGTPSAIIVHSDFRDAVTAFDPEKQKPARHKGPLERVWLESWKPTPMTREELEYPSPEEENLPDPERPGLTRAQGHVAKWGHVQVRPIRERKKRTVIPGLPLLMRALDKPLTDFLEQGVILVPPEEVVALLPETSSPETVRRRLSAALRAISENLERSWRYVAQLEAALAEKREDAAQGELLRR